MSVRPPLLRSVIAATSALLFPLAACEVGDSAPPIDESIDDIEPLLVSPATRMFGQGQVGVDMTIWNKALISGNGLSPEALHPGDALDALRRLDDAALSDANIDWSRIGHQLHGEALIEYTIQCALPANQYRDVSTPTGTKRFWGYAGLAPGWATGRAGLEDQRWVSACLLAHANAFEVRVDIMLMGKRSGLERSPATSTLPRWGFQEAAFYGDLFQEPLPTLPKPYMFACVGYDAQRDCDEHAFKVAMEGRYCGRRVPGVDCRFTVVGPCNDTRTTEEACGPYGAPYDDCAQELQTRGSGAFPVKEVITVFLRTSADVAKMHPECSAPRFAATFGGVDLCVPGAEQAPEVHQCVTEVCEADSFCCAEEWDWQCVGEIGSICETPCGAPEHSFCDLGAPLHIYGSPEANLVCTSDPYCCDVRWDQQCVSAAQTMGFCP